MTTEAFVCLVNSVTRNIIMTLASIKSASAQRVPNDIQGFVILDSHLEIANLEMVVDIYIIHQGMLRVHKLLLT
jgi:hypothetical protein